MKPSPLALTGRTRDHVVPAPELGRPAHPAVVAPYLRLAERARRDGFELRVDSGFRDFALQLDLWNRRARGERPVRDRAGTPLDIATLAPGAICDGIMNWLAVPGSSRHHWGTDLDIHVVQPDGGRPDFVPQEALPGGSAYAFDRWLEDNLAHEGFFRPYRQDLGGVAPEWWHISYAPAATEWYEAIDPAALHEAISSADILHKEVLLARVEEIHRRYVLNISKPAP